MKRHSYTSLTLRSTLGAAIAFLWLMPAPVQAQDEGDRGGWFGGSGAYDFCLARIEQDPEDAFDRALSWRDQGGGPPAIHCSALALIALEQYGDAADRLDTLAQDTRNGLDAPLRAQILIQAANAWMLEGFPQQGTESLDAALSLGIENSNLSAEIYFDRGRARVMDGDSDGAIDDLSRALDFAPGAKDALTLRGTVYRTMGETALAEADLSAVLDRDADYAPALLERGVIYQTSGNTDAARADWIRVLQVSGEGELGDAARRYLHDLDFPDGL